MTSPLNLDALSVIYLEDEPLISYDTSEHLKEIGFGEVKAVYRLQAAEDAVARRRFDLAILDINVDGRQTSIDLGRRLAQAGTPVIFASGNGGQARALVEDGHRFINKPFALAVLTNEIGRALNLPLPV